MNTPTTPQTLVRVSVDVPWDIYHYRQEQHMKWRELLYLGFKAHQKNPEIQERIRVLEEENSRLRAKLSSLAQRQWELEEAKACQK